jgi:Gpi18-like mannosyltransferase
MFYFMLFTGNFMLFFQTFHKIPFSAWLFSGIVGSMREKFTTLEFEFKTVILPFFGSRIFLVMVGLLSPLIRASDLYPIKLAVERAWQFTPYRLLDMWARWDTGWYYSIAANGYVQTEPGSPTNLAFFPLYPYLIRASNFFLLNFREHRTTFTLIGVVISNLAFLGALLILAKILQDFKYRDGFIRNTIWVVLIFPLGFFFSTLLTESLLLFFVMAAMWACIRRKWLLCAVAASLAMVTRPLGQLVIIPIAISYLAQNKDKIRWKEILPFALVPLTIFGYIWSLYLISGDWFAILNVHSAWNHSASTPWQTLFRIDPYRPTLSYLNICIVIGMIILSVIYIWKFPHKEWGIWGLLMIILPLFLGVSNSLGRYSLMAFPAFIALNGLLENRPELRRWAEMVMIALQVLLFIGWVRFYWVG